MKIKKIISIFVIVSFLLPQISSAQSFSLSGGMLDNLGMLGGIMGYSNLDDIVDRGSSETEERYGFDQNILRNARQKEETPTADVQFSVDNPKEGDEVSASAYGLKFRNSIENLYFTWYITHQNEDGEFVDSSGNVISEEHAIENGKTEAMGMVARGDYDPVLFGEDYDFSNDDDYDNNYDDQDGYHAPYGGGDGAGGVEGDKEDVGEGKCNGNLDNHDDPDHEKCGIGTYDVKDENLADVKRMVSDGLKISRCYRHNFGTQFMDANEASDEGFDSGKDLIVECKHQFPLPPKEIRIEGLTEYDVFENSQQTIVENECWTKDLDGDWDEPKNGFYVGDGSFSRMEELCWKLNPKSPDTDGDGVSDEADLAGLGQSTFTWKYKEGDRVGVTIEGTSLVAINQNDAVPEPKEIEDELEIDEDGTITTITYPSDDTDNDDGYQPETKEVVDTLYLGGGYINTAQFVAAVKSIMTRDFDSSSWNYDYTKRKQAIEDILIALDEAGAGVAGGIIDAEEMQDLLASGWSPENIRDAELPVDVAKNPDNYFYVDGGFSGEALYSNIQEFFRINPNEARYCVIQEPVLTQMYIARKISPTRYWDGTYDWNVMVAAGAWSAIATALEEHVFYMNACGGPYPYWSTLFEYWAGTNKNSSSEQYELLSEDFLAPSGTAAYLDPLESTDPNYDLILGGTQYISNLSGFTTCNYTFFENGINILRESTPNKIVETLEQAFTYEANNFFTESISNADLENITSSFVANEANAYYKIMWASPGICSKVTEDDVENDACEEDPSDYYGDNNYSDKFGHYFDYDINNDTEYGFNYLATKPAFLKYESSLDTVLGIFPEEPFINDNNPKASDLIAVKAVFKDNSVGDKDFIYYDWEIYQCQGLNDETCTDDENNRLTKKCGGSDDSSLKFSLENCTMDGDVIMFESSSFASGMGEDELVFVPNGFYGDDKNKFFEKYGNDEEFFLKVVLKTRKNISDDIIALSSETVRVAKRDMAIKFYKVKKDGNNYEIDTSYGDNGDGEICDGSDGFSDIVCPVYPYQTIAVKADFEPGTEIESYLWKLNGENIIIPQSCEGTGCRQNYDDALAFFSVRNLTSLQDVTLKATTSKSGVNVIKDEEISRGLAVENPMAFIKTVDVNAAWSRLEEDQEYRDNVGNYVYNFYTNPGKRVKFRADIVPDYLLYGDNEIEVTWYIGGQEVSDTFIANNTALDIFLSTNSDKESVISFVVPGGNIGDGNIFSGMDLGVRVQKKISDKAALSSAWGINVSSDVLETFSSISLKRDYPDVGLQEDVSSVKMFFASTIRNTPAYLIFSLKLSIIIVLIWSALFGSTVLFNDRRRT